MARRSRILAYGGAGVVVLAGVVCAALVGGLTGELLTIVLLSLGLGALVVLVFIEVGLSEDREYERQARAAGQAKRRRSPLGKRPDGEPQPWLTRRPRRPS